jgi:hypothetical protein
MDLREIGWEAVVVAQDGDQWWAFVKIIMDLRVP